MHPKDSFSFHERVANERVIEQCDDVVRKKWTMRHVVVSVLFNLPLSPLVHMHHPRYHHHSFLLLSLFTFFFFFFVHVFVSLALLLHVLKHSNLSGHQICGVFQTWGENKFSFLLVLEHEVIWILTVNLSWSQFNIWFFWLAR